jgi:hypothetical protein
VAEAPPTGSPEVSGHPAEAEELVEADAPSAPPATPTNGAEFDVEGEARRAYFEELLRVQS